MHGFGGHTFKWVNDKGEVFFIKYTIKSEEGFVGMTRACTSDGCSA